jgi:hypothetical protein
MLAKNVGKICTIAANYRAFALKLASLNNCGLIPRFGGSPTFFGYMVN